MPAPNTQLEAFLAEEARDSGVAAPVETTQADMVPDPGHELLEAEPAPAATPEPAKVEAKPEDKPEDDDDGEVDPGHPVVARHAYEAERRKRQDFKEKWARSEEREAAIARERDELRQRLEEATRAAQQPATQPPQQAFEPTPPPDFDTNPRAYLQYMQAVHAHEVKVERFNRSEEALRDKIGDEKTDAYIQDFKAAVQANPALQNELEAQRNPYKWVAQYVDRVRAQKEIGDDPSAFRARVEQELRAKWEAEQTQAAAAKPAQPTSSVPAMQPSLAGARSVAGRVAPAFPEDISLEEVLAPIQNRKNTNGSGNTYRF